VLVAPQASKEETEGADLSGRTQKKQNRKGGKPWEENA
jgi:hypothetical protein